MSEELKPCPYCGGRAEIYKYAGSDFRTVFIMCTNCKIGTPRRALAHAIEQWNKGEGLE